MLGHRNILYLDSGDGYMTIYVCQNSLNCTLEMGTFYYINYNAINLF